MISTGPSHVVSARHFCLEQYLPEALSALYQPPTELEGYNSSGQLIKLRLEMSSVSK